MSRTIENRSRNERTIFSQPNLAANRVRLHRSRLTRVQPDQLPRRRLTARDQAMLLALYDFDALSTSQLEQLLDFPRIKHASGEGFRINPRLQERLRYLFHAGYVQRTARAVVPGQAPQPLVYWLDRRGAELVARVRGLELAELDWSPRQREMGTIHLQHLLDTNSVRIEVIQAARNDGYTIPLWLSDRALRRREHKDIVTIEGPNGGTSPAAVCPDGFFRLQTPAHREPHNLALELDRGTVTAEAIWGRRSWQRRIKAYLAWYASGRFERRYGSGLRVLTVTTTAKRLETLLRATEKVGGRSRFWFTTLQEVSAATILTRPIWRVARRSGAFRLIETASGRGQVRQPLGATGASTQRG